MAWPGLITGGVDSSWRFLAPAWRGSWAAMLAAGFMIGIALARRLETPHSPWAGTWPCLAALSFLAAQGSLWRLALGQGRRPGPGGLQFGRMELVLLKVWLLNAAFLFVLAMLAFVAVLCCAYAVASAGAGFAADNVSTWAPAVDVRGRFVVSAIAMLSGAGLVWAASRIALAFPASAAGQRVRVLSTWPLTRGRAWLIALTNLLVGAGPLALAFAGALLARSMLGDRPISAWIASLANGLIIAGLWLPLNVGLMTYFHARLARDQPRLPP